MASNKRSGRSPVRGWLEPKKNVNVINLPVQPAKSKPIAQVRPVFATVPPTNVVKAHQSPAHASAANNVHFPVSAPKPAPPRDQRTAGLPNKSQSHKNSKAGAPSKSANVIKIVNVNVINVKNVSDLAKLDLKSESSSSVGCSSGNGVKHKPKTVRPQPQNCQSVPRNNTPKSGKFGNKKNDSGNRPQVVVVAQKQSSVCRIVNK